MKNQTLIPGHYSSTDRVFSRLPDLFNDNWLTTSSVGNWEKALDVPNAVYPYNIKLIKNDKTFLEKEPLEKASKAGQLFAYKHEGFWQCMDTKRDKDKLEKILK